MRTHLPGRSSHYQKIHLPCPDRWRGRRGLRKAFRERFGNKLKHQR